ncbi:MULTISPECIES: O-acetylhomoserine aminocarboxypropyltransferase/cysteine synthase family protein [unclassified Campylobacter]|uniref:O-acetylhomoserine aminocarboxypropyltransferase/cysteine synthase family protein n=1 Tax=unclassified Campylobacter TaxID=2593542 RepID=UPI0012382E5D|nr:MULTISPECIES: O-acetylhomoserine aminocarboxypropyltransferase/cysteine synthase family protein [unclassified Campylobacter]KAA6226456.1 O-acetylhomoserine aminocarboxypropyltransferase/cysteine synthase [Campylobacter sp. LR185c]KAA6228592.1 O-acetylhomoserine aminocarboxypropyltransferase/cysteine synthase [Campylobacter sp. LR196d]KAA6229145.1 O-acetylhomoserine aminocarboxypropyltransferase/cysteine synthase [Campylobacter sp. LR286c]KAA6233936.1 O-acetylhomoserine aminocarboxypropyltran
MADYSQSTLALHAAYEFDTQRTISVPIYQSTAYSFEDLAQAEARFSLKEMGNTYSRIKNPTVAILQQRLAEVEGGIFGVCTASGMAAVFYALLNCAQIGDTILYSNKIYGGTQTLLAHTFPKRFGIKTKEFDIDDLNSLENLIDDSTKAIFFESLSNPQIAIADTEKITQIAKKYGIISICDNTVATPFLHKAFDFGVDIVVHSLSKYINGQGNTLGGAIIERKGLNPLIKNNPRYKPFNIPDESYHGLVYASVDEQNLPIYSFRILAEWLKNIGATMSATSAWQLLQGLETLSLRIQKHSQNALEIAKFLQNHPNVKEVNYPGLANNPYNALLKKYFINEQASGLLSFEARDYEHAKSICNKTKIFKIVANLGDSKSLIIHPASTTHSQLSQEELKNAQISPSTIRLSIGLEDAKDLIADLDQAIRA